MTVLMFVRHGETEDNRLEVFQGHGGSPLNEEGLRQAEALAERMKSVRFAGIWASDLERAAQTARCIAQRGDYDVRLDARLREVNVGAWEGKGRDEIRAQFPHEWEAWRRGEDIRRGGGELYAEVGARAARLVHEVSKDARHEDVLLFVSHAGAIRACVTTLLGMPLDSLSPVRNTGVSCVGWQDGRGKLLLWSDASHLGDPLSFLPVRA